MYLGTNNFAIHVNYIHKGQMPTSLSNIKYLFVFALLKIPHGENQSTVLAKDVVFVGWHLITTYILYN